MQCTLLTYAIGRAAKSREIDSRPKSEPRLGEDKYTVDSR